MNNGINNYGGWSNQNPLMAQNSLSYSPNAYSYRNNILNQQSNTSTSNYYNQSQNNIIWVNGKENARSMQLPPNSTVILLDNETQKFYIKTTDDIGLGKIRIFSYEEEPDIDTSQKIKSNINFDLSNYVTKELLLKAIGEIKENEQFISTTKLQLNKPRLQFKSINKLF